MAKNYLKKIRAKNFGLKMILIAALAIFTGCSTEMQTTAEKRTEFPIYKGTNVSHWLSQTDYRGDLRRNFFTEKDVQNIASIGFDHVRIPIDGVQMWKDDGTKEEEAFALLHNALQWCKKYQIKVIIDLHVLRSHHFNEETNSLWTNPVAQERFFALWRDLSEEFGHYPVSDVAYELLNEPVSPDPQDWNLLVAKTLKVIRENEPDRIIVVGSNGRQSIESFQHLEVPTYDKNIILSFHYYSPLLLTHYKAFWTEVGDYEGPVHYPGQTVKDSELAVLPMEMAERLKRFGASEIHNSSTIDADFRGPLGVAKRYGLKLYCGEWGAVVTAPKEDRLRWYRDVRKALNKHKIAWSTWDYKSTGFGFTNGDGVNHDIDLINILTSNR